MGALGTWIARTPPCLVTDVLLVLSTSRLRPGYALLAMGRPVVLCVQGG